MKSEFRALFGSVPRSANGPWSGNGAVWMVHFMFSRYERQPSHRRLTAQHLLQLLLWRTNKVLQQVTTFPAVSLPQIRCHQTPWPCHPGGDGPHTHTHTLHTTFFCLLSFDKITNTCLVQTFHSELLYGTSLPPLNVFTHSSSDGDWGQSEQGSNDFKGLKNSCLKYRLNRVMSIQQRLLSGRLYIKGLLSLPTNNHL